MLGVTIGVNAPFDRMAKEAARTFSLKTGMDSVVLDRHHFLNLGVKHPAHLKFELFNIFPNIEEFAFFDADIVFLRGFHPNDIRGSCGFSVVRDLIQEEWIINDAKAAGVPVEGYFNSGLFYINKSRARLLDIAREIQQWDRIKTAFHDQTHMNAACLQDGGASYLHPTFNYHVDPKYTIRLRDLGIIGAHMHFIKDDPERIEEYYLEPLTLFWHP